MMKSRCFYKALNKQNKEVYEFVMAGLKQIKEGKTKSFNTVCDRLEKKYKDRNNIESD